MFLDFFAKMDIMSFRWARWALPFLARKGRTAVEKKKAPWIYYVVRWLVWLFSPKFRIVGQENLPEGACVIVGNHCHAYGPIAAEIYTPGLHYTWCTGEMMERGEVADYAFRDFWSMKPKWTLWFFRLLSHAIVPLSLLVFRNACTIPVYHDSRILTTFRQTGQRLAEGARITIFPETYTPHNNIVYQFQDRFLDLARMYRKKSGRDLPFVPMYLAPKLKTVYYGKPIYFDADAPLDAERQRVCRALMDAVTDMALALPRHKVVPYPNVSARHFHYNVPLEVYDHDQNAV